MKHFILCILSCTFLASASAWAKPPSFKPNFERLSEELQLSEHQKQAFLEVMEEQHEQRRAIHRENREAGKARMQGLREQLIAKLETILTADQLEQIKERMEKRRKARLKHQRLNAYKDCCHQEDMETN